MKYLELVTTKSCHCEPEGCGNLVLRLFRRCTPRNDLLVFCFRNDFTYFVIPDLIRNPVFSIWIPAFAGMTDIRLL